MMIYNKATKQAVSKELFDKKRAKARIDKLDNEYGAYVHILIDYTCYMHRGIIVSVR